MGLFTFIAGLLVVLSGVLTFFGALTVRGSSRKSGIGFAVVLLFIGGLIITLDSFTTVAARGVAVQTSFGKVRGEPLGPGLHRVAPWNNIEEFDASVQTLKFYANETDRPKDSDNPSDGDDGGCIGVRLGNNTTACVDVTAQWNINHKGDVNAMYLQYKTFDNIHDNLVIRQLGSALNEVFGTYDPLATVDNNGRANINTKDLQDKVKTALQNDLDTGIQIDSVTIPIVHFDDDTENRLKAFQAAKADTRIAEQRGQTAKAQAAANNELAASQAVKDPGVQYQNCLDLIDRLGKANQLNNLPPTFNCNQGAQAGTIIQAR